MNTNVILFFVGGFEFLYLKRRNDIKKELKWIVIEVTFFLLLNFLFIF